MNDIFGKVREKKEYPYRLQKCPGCSVEYPSRSIRQHVTIHAKREPFWFMLGKIKATPHFDFYKKHTTDARTPSITQRVWTD